MINIEKNPTSTRRVKLIDLMNRLENENKNCFSCKGYCCTYEHNSMLVTPIEAWDVYLYLKSQNMITDKLIQRIKNTINEYRLDKELFIGNGREFRRNYTCPFFNMGPKGCSIAPESKPYGCLGFNPLEKGVSFQGKCTSYVEELEQQDLLNKHNDEALNAQVKESLSLYWDKKNLPVAVLEIVDNMASK